MIPEKAKIVIGKGLSVDDGGDLRCQAHCLGTFISIQAGQHGWLAASAVNNAGRQALSLSLAEPLTATLLLLREQLPPPAFVGLVLLLGGLVVLVRSSTR
jgi:hypothetical protein